MFGLAEALMDFLVAISGDEAACHNASDHMAILVGKHKYGLSGYFI